MKCKVCEKQYIPGHVCGGGPLDSIRPELDRMQRRIEALTLAVVVGGAVMLALVARVMWR